ncbi:MAG: hypothetical protein HKO87_07990, partial [Acidimicrobiia bacterium]|nr:hypothetical protein [Acidimicrobiia bacterium]
MRRLLIAIVLVVAACGQATTIDEYFMDIVSAAQDFDAATEPLTAGVDLDSDLAALAENVDPNDPEQVAQFFEDATNLAKTQTDIILSEAEVAAAAFVARLAGIDPPNAVADEHATTVQRGEALVEEIPRTRASLDAAQTLDDFADALAASPIGRLSEEFSASCRDLQAIADGE